MKILKKAMSAFSAALMCIPSGILTIVNAVETSQNQMVMKSQDIVGHIFGKHVSAETFEKQHLLSYRGIY